MKKTKKAYREYLNNKYGHEIDKRGSLRGASKRLYGDYLYAADKEMFDICYKEWLGQF